jgi:NAD(P)-dependent dehydrogenase (short-subunit alcohol dehydrogenase family)
MELSTIWLEKRQKRLASGVNFRAGRTQLREHEMQTAVEVSALPKQARSADLDPENASYLDRGDTADPFDLTGRIALVTGAGRGIGKAIAMRLAAQGAHVVVSDLAGGSAEETLSRLIERGSGSGDAVALDVSDPKQVETVTSGILSSYGKIDILVNNAGICLNATAEETSDDIWSRQMKINLDSVFYCCRTIGATMIKRKRGSIVNISSMAALIDVRPERHIAYNVSKAGVAHFSRMLASEWGDRGVRVNAVAPGFSATEMLTSDQSLRDSWISQVPLGRFLQPYEIANAVAFLVSDAASAITGALLLADGGVTTR